MSGFAFQVACLRLVANEPLFGFYAVPVDWPVFYYESTDGPKFVLLEKRIISLRTLGEPVCDAKNFTTVY